MEMSSEKTNLIHRKVKVDNEWQTRRFPVVGGRLRLAHEENDSLSLQTEMVNWDGQYAVFKCCAVTGKGQFIGYGTANSQRDAKLADSVWLNWRKREASQEPCDLRDLASNSAVQRRLHTCRKESLNRSKPPTKSLHQCSLKAMATAKRKRKRQVALPAETGSKPQRCGIGQATQAQCRALYALTKRAKYQEADIGDMLARFDVSRFQDLSRESASQLIGHLQTEVAA